MLVKKPTRKWNTVSLSKCYYFTDINISRTPGVHLIYYWNICLFCSLSMLHNIRPTLSKKNVIGWY